VIFASLPELVSTSVEKPDGIDSLRAPDCAHRRVEADCPKASY
jgi:hypothetical protein